MPKKHGLIRGIFLLAVLVIAFGCGGGGDKSELNADPNAKKDALAPKMTMAPYRRQFDVPLTIVIPPSIEDKVVVEYPGLPLTYSNYRGSIEAGLKEAFSKNFTAVTVVDKETGKGVEIILDKAAVTQQTTINFSVTLMSDGKMVGDSRGDTTGRTILMSASAFNYKKVIWSTNKTLLEEAVDKLVTSVFDGTVRNQKIEDAGFWSAREKK